jgi:SAM-dependent methyltransferase
MPKCDRMETNTDWEAWGRADPLYGVATLPGREGSWQANEFFRLGADDWQVFRPHWEQYGVERDCCVEIGCGAGRMTAQLADEFARVEAVDVSPAMLERAEDHIKATNVTFHASDGVALPLADRSVTAAFSVHVFQHFPSLDVAAANFAEIYRVLVTGGTLMIHLPIVVWPHGRFVATHRRLDRVFALARNASVATKRLSHRKGWSSHAPMAILSYETDWLDNTLTTLGFTDFEIRLVFSESPMARRHPFVFARKR